MTTIRDIASKAGVSHMTVSNVLNGRFSATRSDAAARAERIRSIADELGYRPSAAARSMTEGKTRIVAVAIRDERFGYEALLGLNRVIEASGYILVLVPMDDIVGDSHPHSRVFAERLVDGLAVLSCTPNDLDRVDTRLPELRSRTVFIDTNRYTAQNCIRRNEMDAGQRAAKELVKLGFDQIAYFDRPDIVQTYCFSERRNAIRDFCHQNSISLNQVPVPVDKGGFPAVDQAESFYNAFPWEHTAVLASDTTMARIIRTQWMQHRLVPGLDYSLACCDETSEEAQLWPQLSRVSFDRAAMGETAGHMILKLLADEEPSTSLKTTGEWIPGSTAVHRSTLFPNET